ncbi:MAG: fatty acid desaturase, partial [Pseudomonadales bacterium]
MVAPDYEQFPLDETRTLVRGLFEPDPLIYWVDFLFSTVFGWIAFIIAVTSAPFSIVQIVFYVVASLALYRSAIFIHELAHFKENTFGVFRFVWNVTCGLPLMLPAFAYRGMHSEHHRQKIYGTKLDGEYVPFALRGTLNIVCYLLLPLLLPIFAAFRSLVLTPVSYISKPLSRLVWTRASSLSIDLNYVRSESTKAECPTWQLEQLGAFGYAVLAILLVAGGWIGYEVLMMWYLVA